jgi:hypothetical protein
MTCAMAWAKDMKVAPMVHDMEERPVFCYKDRQTLEKPWRLAIQPTNEHFGLSSLVCYVQVSYGFIPN